MSHGPSLDELRELSRRSRRAQRAGFLALLVALVAYPAQALLGQWISATWITFGILAIAALPFLRYAYLAGEERGAFRRVFRRIADDARTRTIVPTEAQTGTGALAQAPAQTR